MFTGALALSTTTNKVILSPRESPNEVTQLSSLSHQNGKKKKKKSMTTANKR